MVLKKIKLSKINGPLHYQVQQSKLINMPVHQLIIIPYHIQAINLFLHLVLEANYSKNPSLETHIMELGTQILLRNMSLLII